MSNKKITNHYVPRLVLRKFSDKLSVYNVKTGELSENIKPEHAFEQCGLYNDEIESKLNLKIESQFGNLLSNILLQNNKEISLTRLQVLLIKKFLLISELRTIQNEALLQREREFHKIFGFPFVEKTIEGETPYEYWMRTISVVLDSDGTPDSIRERPDKTYAAYRWSMVINSGYIAFWDAPDNKDEFVITDIGMTSENEKGWDGHYIHNDRKLGFLKTILNCVTSEAEKREINRVIYNTCNFSENFMMFPISARRMIVLICPFYKIWFSLNEDVINLMPLGNLTVIPNEELFQPNRNYYEATHSFVNTGKYHENDRYIYDIKNLNRDEIRYCNALFMDRIDTYLGFSSLDHALGSILKYKKLNAPPYTPRVKYDILYRIIEERYS